MFVLEDCAVCWEGKRKLKPLSWREGSTVKRRSRVDLDILARLFLLMIRGESMMIALSEVLLTPYRSTIVGHYILPVSGVGSLSIDGVVSYA